MVGAIGDRNKRKGGSQEKERKKNEIKTKWSQWVEKKKKKKKAIY